MQIINEHLESWLASNNTANLIPVNVNATTKMYYAKDGIHFNNEGRKKLVQDVKNHMNSILGLKPYNNNNVYYIMYWLTPMVSCQ